MQLDTYTVEGVTLYSVKDLFAALEVTAYRKHIAALPPGDYNKPLKAVTQGALISLLSKSRSPKAPEVMAWVEENILTTQAPEPPKPKLKRGTATPVMAITPDVQRVLDLYIANAMPPRFYDSFVPKARKAVAEYREFLQKMIETYDLPEDMWFASQVGGMDLLNLALDCEKPGQDPLTCWAPETIEAFMALWLRHQKGFDWDRELPKHRLPGLPRPKKESF